jgi:putative ABC transport system permease protein
MTPYDEIEEEMQWHLEARAADLEKRGLSAAEAKRRARLEFGSVGRFREEGREARRGAWIGKWRSDFEIARRTLRRQPLPALGLALQLALSVAVASAGYAMWREAFGAPLQTAGGERILNVRTVTRGLIAGDTAERTDWPVNLGQFQVWGAECRSCEALGLVGMAELHWLDNRVARRLEGLQVSPGFFEVLGLPMRLGRPLRVGEDDSVVISAKLWRERFASDDGAVGAHLFINGRTMRLVGVLREDAFLPVRDSMGRLLALPERVDALTPFTPAAAESKRENLVGQFNWGLLVKARPGAGDVEQELTRIVVRHGVLAEQMSIRARSWNEELREAAQGRWMALLGGAGAWLLLSFVCCLGFAQARRGAREAEEELQEQLGAGSMDQWRRRCAEAIWIVLPACAVMVGITAWLIGWAAAPIALLLGALGLAVLTMAPARGSQRWAIVLQSSLATVLAGASLLWGTGYLKAIERSEGFAREGAISFQIAAPAIDAGGAKLWELEKSLLRHLRKDPRVLAAATASRLPLQGAGGVFQVRAEGEAASRRNVRVANWRMVSEDYFAAMGIPLLRGRELEESDAGRRVVVLSAMAAREAFGSVDVLGRRIHYVWDGEPAMLEIVGVAGDVRAEAAGAPEAMVYMLARPKFANASVFVARGLNGVASVADAAREAVGVVSGEARIHEARELEDLVARGMAVMRMQAVGLGLLALSGLGLACLALGVMVHCAARGRAEEMALRRAFGATRGDLAMMLSREALLPVVAGIAVGLGLVGAVVWCVDCWSWLVLPAVAVGILGASGVAVYAAVHVSVCSSLPKLWYTS